MSGCHVKLKQEVIAKVSPQFQDMELTRRSQAGDKEAFDELVTKYRIKLFTMVCGIVRDEHDAWDLAQEGFLRAWKSIHWFEGRSSFYAWLYSITVNLAIYSLRRKGRRKEVELNEAIPSSLPSPSVEYQRAEIREQVNKALARLSPEHRAVVLLKEVEGLQYHEIAEILDLSIGTVMSRLFCARKKLQFMLQPIYGELYKSLKPVKRLGIDHFIVHQAIDHVGALPIHGAEKQSAP
jgi:RNA polymerase sigma-70 factor, ECF subfamily